MAESLDALRALSARNQNLNAAYVPKWDVPADLPLNYVAGLHGDTQFDPFLGSGWGDWLDAIGASNAGGTKLQGGSLPMSPEPVARPSMMALRTAARGKR